MRHTFVSFVLISMLAIATIAQTTAGGDQAKSDSSEPKFPNVAVANDSKELSWLLEEGNKNLYLVLFYMSGDDHEKVLSDLKTQVAGNTKFKDIVTYVEVNAARTYQYKEMLEEIGIYSEPSRLYPYVMLVKSGEGYLFRGSKIGDMVLQKIQTVIDGRVSFAQPS